MRLVRFGQKRWTVLAVMDDRGDCPVLELLKGAGDPGARVLADLQEVYPERGPPRNSEASKALRDKILEFREPTTKGGTLRVLYFFDKGYMIICANGCLKKKDKTPDDLIDAAIAIRNTYFAAQTRNEIAVEELPPDELEEEV
jgi:hypothetical protein